MDKGIIMHVDVNSAYLSWEAAYRLQHGDSVDLRLIPSVVGGDEASRHGIVLAKSIPAKKWKIQTGESLYAVRRRCPDIVIVPPRYDLYMQCSAALLALLGEYSPNIQVFSIDECFMDFTGMGNLWKDPVQAAHVIRERVKKELGFTINIGISTNKLLAKTAGDLEKPDMVHTLFREEIPSKMWPLPVEGLYMVGRATALKLHEMGIYTIGELARMDPEHLKFKFKSWGAVLWNFANGIEESKVGDRPQMKGIGNSVTLPFDADTREDAHRVLLSLAETVCMRLRQAGYCARLVAVSIKSGEFLGAVRQHKFSMPTDCTQSIYEIACRLFDGLWRGQAVRNLGIRVSELCAGDYVQLDMFERYSLKKHQLDTAIDKIRMKYGSGAVIRSCFLNSGLRPVAGGVMQEDYQMMSSIL